MDYRAAEFAPITPDEISTCDVCGESLDENDDLGEFISPITDAAVIAHAECGVGNGLDVA